MPSCSDLLGVDEENIVALCGAAIWTGKKLPGWGKTREWRKEKRGRDGCWESFLFRPRQIVSAWLHARAPRDPALEKRPESNRFQGPIKPTGRDLWWGEDREARTWKIFICQRVRGRGRGGRDFVYVHKSGSHEEKPARGNTSRCEMKAGILLTRDVFSTHYMMDTMVFAR